MRLWHYIFLMFVVFLFGCRKYPDGPELSLRTKKSRLENKWQVDKRFLNGVNIILGNDDLIYIEFKKDGTFEKQVEDANGGPKPVRGTWEFTDRKKRLVISTPAYTSKIGSVPQKSEVCRILRLANDQFWISDEVENPTLVTYFKPL
jgi:hypothetical protein